MEVQKTFRVTVRVVGCTRKIQVMNKRILPQNVKGFFTLFSGVFLLGGVGGCGILMVRNYLNLILWSCIASPVGVFYTNPGSL